MLEKSALVEAGAVEACVAARGAASVLFHCLSVDFHSLATETKSREWNVSKKKWNLS